MNGELPPPEAPPPAQFVVQGSGRPVVGPALIALNVLWFVWMLAHGVSAVDPSAEDGLRFGANHGPAILAGEWWRLLSAAFVHYGLMHIAMNLWALWVLAPLAEQLYGRVAYLVLYLLGAIGCSCASVLMQPEAFSAGASGAVFATMGGIFAFFLLHRRDMPPGVFATVIKKIVLLLGLNLAMGFMVPNIDNAGHFGGLAAGMVAGWALDRDPRGSPRLDGKRAGAALFLAVMLGGVCAFIPGRVMRSPRAGTALELARAEDAFERSDWSAVEEHATAALRLEPADADALQLRALARAEQGRVDDALSDCDLALVADPRASEALRLRAELRAKRGELESARKDLVRLVELLPSNARARLLFGRAQLALGAARDAAVTLETAAKLDERDAGEAQLWLWMARVELGLREEADEGLAEFEKSAHGEDLERSTRGLVLVALRGEGNAGGAPLGSLLRALRALHPAQGVPDRAAARTALAASTEPANDPWVVALRARIEAATSR